MVPVCLYIAGGFLEQHAGPASHHVKKKNNIWHPFWWEGECQHERIRRRTKCSQPSSLTQSAWQPKSKPFSKLQHLHLIVRRVALKISLPWRQHSLQWNWSLLNYEGSIAQPCSPATLKSTVVGIKRMVNFYIRETRDDLVSGMLSLLPQWPLELLVPVPLYILFHVHPTSSRNTDNMATCAFIVCLFL